MALLWEFSRQIDADAQPVGLTSYYDEQCQSLYLKGGSIRTKTGEVLDGLWQLATAEDEDSLSAVTYSALSVEHHFNGKLFGVACKDGKIVFLMHKYQT